VVHFYGGDEELAGAVSGYLGEGLRAGHGVLVVATAPHRLAFEAGLIAAGVDAGAAAAAGRLVMVDAAGTLRGFLDGGRLDPVRFEAAAGRMIGPLAAAGGPVRIYAEMVALLWDAGHVPLALELEELWNDLRSRLPFSLLCGYSARLVAGEDHVAARDEVRRLHSAVIGSEPGWAGTRVSGQLGDAVRSFPAAHGSARAARHFVTSTLHSRYAPELLGDAAMVTAELAANAVLHACSDFTVTVSPSAAGVRLAVRDAAPVPSMNGRSRLVASRDHGLGVVAALADQWGVEPLAGGKVVWAELRA
jgi:hypothetical protein